MSGAASSEPEVRLGLGRVGNAVLLAATLLVVGLNEAVGRSQFAGYDQSPFIDLAWRLANGQRPGVDFVSTLPLGFVGAVKAALLGWPPGMALLTHAGEAVFALAVGAVSVAVAGMPRPGAARLAVVTWAVLAAPLLATNHLWHSVQAQQLAVAFVALIAGERRGAVARGVTIVVAALLILSKPNLGLPLWLALGGVRLIAAGAGERPRVAGALLAELAAAVAVGVALAAWLGLDAAAVRAAWLGGSERAVPNPVVLLGLLLLYPVNTSLLGLCGLLSVAVATVSRRALAGAPRGVGVVAAVTGVAWLPFLTDVDTKINAAPLFVVAGVLAADLLPTAAARRDAGRGAVALAVALLLLGAVFGVGRLRARGVAESVLGDYHEVPADHRVPHGPLAGWWVGRTLADTLDELDRLKEEVPPGAPLFFGPKIEFAYAHVGAPPTPGLPLWWHRGTSYPREDEPLLLDRFRAVGFCRLVFRAGDRMRFPEPLRADLETRWTRVEGYQRLDVYRPADGRCAAAKPR